MSYNAATASVTDTLLPPCRVDVVEDTGLATEFTIGHYPAMYGQRWSGATTVFFAPSLN